MSEDQVCFGISDKHVCAVTRDQFGLKSNENRILQRGRGPQIASNAQCHVVMPLLERRDCTCKHTEVSTQGEANPPSYRDAALTDVAACSPNKERLLVVLLPHAK